MTRYCIAATFLLPALGMALAFAIVRMTRCTNCCQKEPK